MSCKRARNLFAAYWDDEATQAEREWLERAGFTAVRVAPIPGRMVTTAIEAAKA